MVTVTVSLPDEVASRAASAAAKRGVTVDELASDALEAYLEGTPAPVAPALTFVGLGDASSGFSVREAEQRLEDEGFEQSRSS